MKKIKILLIALILVLAGAFASVYAADGERSLGAQLTRPFTNLKYQYLVRGNSTDVKYTVVKIYDADDKVDDELAYEKVLYCLRGGKGFGANVQTDGTDISENPISYTELAEMHTNASEVIAKYKELYNVDLDRTETIAQKEFNVYNAILWVLDESYLPKDIEKEIDGTIQTVYSAAEYKVELLDKAGVPTVQQADITDDDLEVIQQLAVWYFANYDEQTAGINPTVSQATIYPAQFLSMDGNNNIGDVKENNLNRIYQYLIYGAIDNAGRYEVDATTGARTRTIESNEFDKTLPIQIESVNVSAPGQEVGPMSYYKIGPVKVKSDINQRNGSSLVDTTSIVLYDANGSPIDKDYKVLTEDENPDGTVINGSLEHSIYVFVDAQGNVVNELQKGTEYFIRFYKAFEKGSTVIPFITEEEQYDVSKVTVEITSAYSLTNAKFLYATEDSANNQAVVEIEKQKISDSDVLITEEFDLSLRKFIVSIRRNGEEIEVADRTPSIDVSKLNSTDERTGEKITTATYTHPKNKLTVEKGDRVVYTIRIYNEGNLDGTATQITDYLPAGLEFVPASESTINATYGWTNPSADGKTIITDYLKDTTIKAYDSSKTTEEAGWQKAAAGESGLYFADVQVECKVVAEVTNQNQELRNIAEISEDNGADRDSTPNNVITNNYVPPVDNSEYQEDDDDYEDLVLKAKEFDLSLRKFITVIKRNGEEVEFEDRTPSINTETLINGTFNRNGQSEYTATYEHSKEPLLVKQGDIITYTLRIYNEGDIDGYATEIIDYIPEGLALIKDYNTNFNNGWKLPTTLDSDKIMNLVGEDGFYKTEEEVKNLKLEDFIATSSLQDVQLITGDVSITTNELQDELLKAFDKNKTETEEGWQKAATGDAGLYYKDVQVSFLVIAPNTCKDVLTNIAEIAEDKDKAGNDIIDRDSTPNNVETRNEDDDDYEPVILKYFDLALRKFITGVETNGQLAEITSRNPNLSINEETGNIKYTHPKEEDPVLVSNNDVVIYTIRIYNEGTLAGYAEEITDDIPQGLEYLPDHNTNKEYEWKMYDKDGNVTENVSEAVKITTDYLSKAKEVKDITVVTDEETGEAVETKVRENLINPFDDGQDLSATNPDYKDVKVAFKVTEENTSDRIIVNSAQISEDSDDDEDSIPDEWNDGEDDQDKEYIYVKCFDLSLLKWVTKTIVTVDGKTTTTETGFKPNTGLTETTGIRDNKEAEPIAKVEIDKNKLNKTTVKFAYKIKVTNEGEIPGYATEITDYIPKGLEFKAEDNKKYGWVKEGEDKVTTRALETVLLEPGESAELEIVFTWKKDKNNLGLKTNIAEITEDYNDHDSKDIDSVPGNKVDPYEKEQEDDDDFALVILSIKTGNGPVYTIFITLMVTILVAGIYLIKRYVLRY